MLLLFKFFFSKRKIMMWLFINEKMTISNSKILISLMNFQKNIFVKEIEIISVGKRIIIKKDY